MGQRLSTQELNYIRNDQCPDCQQKDTLVSGPKGGSAMNVACDNCGSEFNLCLIPDGLALSHRNSIPGQPNLSRLAFVFNISLPLQSIQINTPKQPEISLIHNNWLIRLLCRLKQYVNQHSIS